MQKEKKLLDSIKKSVSLEEDADVLEKLLLEIALSRVTATKALARKLFLPVPLVAAIKKEMVKAGLLTHDTRMTPAGDKYMSRELRFEGLDKELFLTLINREINEAPAFFAKEFPEDYELLCAIFEGRPRVDVTLDQSKDTVDTALKRALLSLREYRLIGKSILCCGDDDLVSIALSMVLRVLFRGKTLPAEIAVLDIDERFLGYIEEKSRENGFPVKCYKGDLRNPLPSELSGSFSSVFTDPPYTLPGMELFLSRCVEALDYRERQGMIFLSFPHKSPDFMVKVFRSISSMGLVPLEIIPRFNSYEGAEIIGNMSQMILLRSTRDTAPLIEGEYREIFYTGELRQTLRTYSCKACGRRIRVGQSEIFTTIELLKEQGCPGCGEAAFDRLETIKR